MKRRMQLVMKSEDLKKRIDEGIARERATMAALGARLEEPYRATEDDVSVVDRETLEKLRRERTHATDRVTQMTLIRDSLVANEEYVLSKADLRCAGIISPDSPENPALDGDWVEVGSGFPIDGLKLTFTGDELRKLLEERRQVHEKRAQRWKHELTRTAEDQTEEAPLLPDQMCENEAEEEEWLADVMAFIRDHVEADETYRLGKADLDFGELLPEKPEWSMSSRLAEPAAKR